MTSTISRRDFIKYAGGGVAVLIIGSKLPWAVNNPAYAATETLSLSIGVAIKEMHTHEAINDARCYFWVYKSVLPDLPQDSPGPVIIAAKGDTVNISVTNDLDEPHAFFIPGIFDSGPIALLRFSRTGPASVALRNPGEVFAPAAANAGFVPPEPLIIGGG